MNKSHHLIISTAICAATMLLFLAFYSKLPDNLPIQITIDGTVGNTLSKPLFVFGFPIIFVAINLTKNLPAVKNEQSKSYSFYIIPAIALVLSGLSLGLAL